MHSRRLSAFFCRVDGAGEKGKLIAGTVAGFVGFLQKRLNGALRALNERSLSKSAAGIQRRRTEGASFQKFDHLRRILSPNC